MIEEFEALSTTDLLSVIEVALEEAYKNEIIDTGMEELDIGEDKDFLDKDDWMVSKFFEWLSIVRCEC